MSSSRNIEAWKSETESTGITEYEGSQELYRKGGSVKYTLATRLKFQSRIVFDSDLDRNTLPGDLCERRHTMSECKHKLSGYDDAEDFNKSYKLTAQLENGMKPFGEDKKTSSG